MIKVPRLKVNRHGVYCIRIYWRDAATQQLKEGLYSLGTKNAKVARVLALQFNEAFERQRAMTDRPALPKLDDLLRKFELDLSKGIMKADGPEDHARMMEAIKAYKELHGTAPSLQEAMNMGRPAPSLSQPPKPLVARSMVLSAAYDMYVKCWRRSNIDHLCRLNFDQGLLPAV